MGDTIPRLTPNRVAWLRLLGDGPNSRNGKGLGSAGADCMKVGWTEWLMRREGTGEVLPKSAVMASYQCETEAETFWAWWNDGWRFADVEILTDAGRARLASLDGRVAQGSASAQGPTVTARETKSPLHSERLR